MGTEPTKADRDLAYELERTGDRNTIAYALAAEREKVRAPFLALADELEREGQQEETEAQRLGKSVTAESWWGSGAASLDAASRIRRAAEVSE